MLGPNHHQAQELAAKAALLIRKGEDPSEAEELYLRAARFEESAFLEIAEDKLRTRGIIGVSLVSLFYKAKAYSQAEEWAFRLLREGNFLPSSQTQLRELLEVARRARPGARILIVDNEEALLASLASAARRRGYHVDTAADGVRALALARQSEHDLVVTDLRLPGLDGPAFIGSLREEGIATRVVVITGYATLEAAVDCLRQGALDFLIKPFENQDFLTSVEKALARPLPRSERACDWDAVSRRFGLTRRQTEVLQAYYATGKSSGELSKDLSLSTHTVKSHLKVACRKLGVSTLGQLERVVREAGF